MIPASTARAGGSGDFHPHHHAAVFLGAGYETKRDGRENEIGIALGVDYEYRFHERWGVGAGVEGLGKDTLRDALIVALASFHPRKALRLQAGPGYEFTETKDKPAFRTGIGWAFHLDRHWTLSPEGFADFIDGGSIT